MRLFAIALTIGAALHAQDSGGKLKLAPSEPLHEPRPSQRETRLPSSEIRGTVLVLLPPADPIHLVDETEEEAGEWRTYRRPKVDAFSRNGEGVAMQGHDVISYREQTVERGSKAFAAEYGGVLWWFANQAHRDLFLSDSKRFVPEYGGFCAYSIGKGYPAPADPKAFLLEGDKLYMFFDRTALKVWEQSRRESIQKGDRNWPMLHR
jgi:YHS domain-containing protein